MRGMRRFWTLVAILGGLAGLAVLAERPALLAAPVGLGAYLVAAQLSAVRAFDTDHGITYIADREQAQIDDPIQLTVTVERPAPAATDLTVTVPVPPACSVEAGDPTLDLAPGEHHAQQTVTLTPVVAGRFTVEAARLHLADRRSMFAETLTGGDALTLDIAPRRPRDIHVGQGGQPATDVYGEHATDQRGAGLLPYELREYVPGDPADRIDWNATARLATPYVLEFEAETDRPTALVVDTREAMAVGEPGRTMLDYARDAGLTLAATARATGDPLTLVRVTDEGPEPPIGPTTDITGYRRIVDRLASLGEPASSDRLPDPVRIDPRSPPPSALGARTPFAETLRPYLADREPIPRPAEAPLVAGVASAVGQRPIAPLVLLLTSDGDRRAVRAAVRQATVEGARVLVMLTPTAVFDPGGLADLETASERYLDFERFRRDLDGLPGVTAFEVGPGDRVAAVLERASRATPEGVRP